MSTYNEAGVNIQTGDEFVQKIKKSVKSTFSSSVLTEIGGFGGFYDAKFPGMDHPVLVSSTDGVGTKLKVAFLMDRHDSIGQDLVNHCVNDIAVCGARPLFFLDYLAVGKLHLPIAEAIVQGLVKACTENGCALIGGETAEMPGFYREGEYDLAGTVVGVVEKGKIFDGKKVTSGDVLIGLPSAGLHTNGFSLARKVLFERFEADDFVDELGSTVGDALLSIHRSYLSAISVVTTNPAVHAFAHITGGGLVGNTSRVVTAPLRLAVDWDSWKIPAIFQLIKRIGDVPDDDMRRAFNLGIGLVIVAGKSGADEIVNALRETGERPLIIGEVRS